MAKRALIIFACLVTIIVVISIIISVINLKPAKFQNVVTYDNGKTVLKSSSADANVDNVSDDIPILSSLLSHEKSIMISSIFIVMLFALLFYGAKRSKS